MKKIISCMLFLFLLGCSSDSDETNNEIKGLPKTLTEFYADSNGNVQSFTRKFIYEGNKLKEIQEENDPTARRIFTYQGDNIVKIEWYRGTELLEKHDIEYNNNNLIKHTEAYFLNGFAYNDGITTYSNPVDRKIDYVKTSSSSMTQKGNIILTNGQVSNEFFSISINNDSQIIGSNTKEFVYDDKNNPYKNIVGYSKLLHLRGIVGLNNVLGEYWVSSSTLGGTDTQFAKQYNVVYNTQNYPTQIDRYTNENVGGTTLFIDRIFKFTYF
jgi:hypothetical protein